MCVAQNLFTHCREQLAAKGISHSHSRKPKGVRQAAVISAAQAFDGVKVHWARAVTTFKKMAGGIPAKAVGTRPLAFIKKWWNTFSATGSLDDAPRSGRPPLLPDDVAQRASELVKGGKWVSVKPYKSRVKQLVLFTSIPQAIQEVPELRDICRQYDLTSDRLRNAMERVDPDLTLHTYHFKYCHPAELVKERQQFCRDMLSKLEPSVAASIPVLEQYVWWDEGGVAISALKKNSIRVWGSKEQLKQCDVVHLPSVQGQEDCKVHFIVAVSAHPAYTATNGLVYFEFTTGTTAMKRLLNTYGQDGEEPYKYMVICTHFTYNVAKYIITHMAVHMYCL